MDSLALFSFLVVILLVPWMMRPVAMGELVTTASERERRLWRWTAVTLLAIYSTLGPAQVLAAALRERNLLRFFVAVVVLTTCIAITRIWIRRRPGRREVGAAAGVAAVYLMAWIRIHSLEERTHLFEYGLVATLIYQALVERNRHGNGLPLPALQAVALTGLLGWVDEGIQAVLPNRVYDLRDVGFNLLAAIIAASGNAVLAWARRHDKNASDRPSETL